MAPTDDPCGLGADAGGLRGTAIRQGDWGVFRLAVLLTQIC